MLRPRYMASSVHTARRVGGSARYRQYHACRCAHAALSSHRLWPAACAATLRQFDHAACIRYSADFDNAAAASFAAPEMTISAFSGLIRKFAYVLMGFTYIITHRTGDARRRFQITRLRLRCPAFPAVTAVTAPPLRAAHIFMPCIMLHDTPVGTAAPTHHMVKYHFNSVVLNTQQLGRLAQGG